MKNVWMKARDEGTWQPDPATDVGEWEEYDLNEMDAKMNDMLYQACPFHPTTSSTVSTPRLNLEV